MDRYAVIGNPAQHSLSPVIHQQFAKQTQQAIRYDIIEPQSEQFIETLEEFRSTGGKGVNITTPFKEQAYHYCQFRSEIAEQAQAVNTISFHDDGTAYADNTDGMGLAQDLMRHHQVSLRKKNILLLGAGGAARGIIPVLLNYTPSQLIVANRHMERAITLAQLFQLKGKIHGMGLEELNGQPFDLVINATSAGLQNQRVAVPDGVIGPDTICYDCCYGAAATPFLQWAKQNNAAMALDGIGMLVEQAAAAFYTWRAVRVQTAPVIKALRAKALA